MVRIVASATLPLPPEKACKVLLNPKLMEKWLSDARGLRADAGWPFHDTSLSWEINHGAGVCEARVVENMLPSSLKVNVSTPTHSRTVTHFFTASEGGTKYERVVEAELFGFAKLFGAGRLRRQVEEEVKRAAKLVAEDR